MEDLMLVLRQKGRYRLLLEYDEYEEECAMKELLLLNVCSKS